MANIPENTTDPILRPVTRLEITTKVFGGEYIPDDEEQRGISNLQAIELAERDQYIISRVGQAKVDPSGDIPGEPGIAPLDTSGKLPKSNNTANVVYTGDTQTLTNKTINFNDNTMTNVAGTAATQTLTGKTLDLNLDTNKITVGTANRVLVSDANKKIVPATDTTDTEIGYVHGVTSAIQTQINSKQDTITGGASSITSSNLTASKVLVSDANGKVSASSCPSNRIGVGQVHYVTSGFINGYSGTILWCVNNGICTVTTSDWGRTSGDGRITGYTGLPPAKMVCYTQLGTYGNLGIDTSGNLSLYQSSGSLSNIFQTITYPVADDWVES